MAVILCDNDKHRHILQKYMKYVKSVVYYVTEDEIAGKFSDFNNILNTIINYSNEFKETNKQNGEISEEWRYMLPNLVLFSTIGFLSGINNSSMNEQIEKLKNNLFIKTSEMIGQITDIYEEEDLKKQIELIIEE
tara:strand:+ start:2369 stop:2773 length:405 start_codon:yes stop_codon:yes gene_type:complete